MNLSLRRHIDFSLFSGSISELLHPPASQIPFLDGLRSIAVLLVISHHLSGEFANAYGPTLYSKLPFVANGWVGVDLFFVLSGFFIGGQLWKEIQSRHCVHISRFVIRRGFRIWPLYFFTFLCVLAFYILFGHGASAQEYGWTDLVFITNYHSRGLVMGSWSLCTEEQFYIVTPIALYFFARRHHPIQNCRKWLWLLMLTVLFLRALLWVHVAGGFFQHTAAMFSQIYYNSITHCDGLIAGLIVANLWVTQEKTRSRFSKPGILVALSIAFLLVSHMFQKEIFDFTSLALFFASLVWFGLQHRPAIFNSRIFYWISRLSFGMYLNHEYMVSWVVNKLLPSSHVSTITSLAANLTGVILIILFSALTALITFCLVEHPFLQLRKRMANG
jgi:peptidoglycan/LPS O-acetylase OafA/YrhL